MPKGGGVTGALPFCVCIAEGSASAATKRSLESVTYASICIGSRTARPDFPGAAIWTVYHT